MKIFPDTKVYMICPANIHSGGPELCHQLVSQLIQFGVDAYLLYMPNPNVTFNPDNPVDDFYVKYHCPYVLKIEDAPHNILILNESANWIYFEVKHIQKIFWWMSVDNYVHDIAEIIKSFEGDALREPMTKFFYFEPDDTEHWVQSAYAFQFVLLNGVSKEKIHVVEDYVSQAFLTHADKIDISKKENAVLFNPKKGFKVTKKLVELAPDIHWLPIINLTPEQVQILLEGSKVYIDFGNHPGKDRIPREAALSGCVVITGKRGAAANDTDINIPAEFKFGETEADLPLVIEKIRDVFDNFEANHAKQNDYRARILDDKSRFAKEVAAAFNLKPQRKNFVALAQGLSKTSIMLADFIYRMNPEHFPTFLIDNRFCTSENSDESTFIKTIQNTNYFYSKKIGGGQPIMIISAEDAKFLYLEGRLNKFALFNPTAEEIDLINKIFNPAQEDLMIVNIE